jgi:hypothetical protein
MALNHTTGISDSTWDYNTFRAHVDSPGLIKKSTELLLAAHRDVFAEKKFEYNNLIWQILSARYLELYNETVSCTLRRLLRSKSLIWEEDADGIPLGPHGLELTKKQATKLGMLVKSHIHTIQPKYHGPQVTEPVYSASVSGVYVVFGWFVSPEITWALGYLCQYIAYRKSDETVHLQLRARLPHNDIYYIHDALTEEESDFIKQLIE